MAQSFTAKNKTIYSCNGCGAQFLKWAGQCAECGVWNSLTEEVVSTQKQLSPSRFSGQSINAQNTKVVCLADVPLQNDIRIPTGLIEFDRTLGGGLVVGSVVLIGGDPGIGKSTLLLQTLCHVSQHCRTLYVTGEESLQQVTLRGRRLGLAENKLQLLAETQVESIISAANREKPQVVVIDSIQTVYTGLLSSAPGSVSQIRESAAQLVHYAKQNNVALFLVGHVTKDGTLAGPRVLEHMVDTVLYFEGDRDSRFRLIRAVKNRFGAANELGIFAMTDRGLREVSNPSSIFLSRYPKPVPGSIVMVTWEGSRPLLVEVQALVDESHLANPRRVTLGLDSNRLAMLLAVLHRHGGVGTYNQDIFVNVVGGVRVTETGIDLALVLSVLSSLRNRPLPNDLVVFGELGLAGEVRPVQGGQERLKEAAKHGFKSAIIPAANAPKQKIEGMEIHAIQRLSEAFDIISEINRG